MEKEIQDLFDGLTARIDAQGETITTQEETITALNQKVDDLSKKYDEIKGLVSSLKNNGANVIDEAIEKKAERATTPTKIFKVEKKKYRFTVPIFNLPIDPKDKKAPHGQMTAEAALEDESILIRLVALGAAVIEEVI